MCAPGLFPDGRCILAEMLGVDTIPPADGQMEGIRPSPHKGYANTLCQWWAWLVIFGVAGLGGVRTTSGSGNQAADRAHGEL